MVEIEHKDVCLSAHIPPDQVLPVGYAARKAKISIIFTISGANPPGK
jgi:phosphoribosylcarboxyaminoimidazole (NCAIR) mutase